MNAKLAVSAIMEEMVVVPVFIHEVSFTQDLYALCRLLFLSGLFCFPYTTGDYLTSFTICFDEVTYAATPKLVYLYFS